MMNTTATMTRKIRAQINLHARQAQQERKQGVSDTIEVHSVTALHRRIRARCEIALSLTGAAEKQLTYPTRCVSKCV